MAYFTSVSTEASATKTYANGATTKFLADSAVNVVEGQIAQATQGQVAGSSTRLTWASQPGMIRTYDDTGLADACYKLYSSAQMVIPSATVQSGSTAVLTAMQADLPTAWNTQPAIYTDINAPVTDSSGVLNFPIMDGNHLKQVTISGSSVLTYCTTSGTVPDIEGTYISSSAIPNYAAAVAVSSTNNPVPMPVQWLYTLQDGTIISPDSGGAVTGTTATFTTAMQAMTPAQQQSFTSGSNPIVGRVAFWTDDESCKLNINTASEGTYYAFPHVNTNTDITSGNKIFGYAISPPATGEFNRYPGHPASTCLSVALGRWLDNTLGGKAVTAPNAYSSTSNNDSIYFGLTGTAGGSYKGLSAYLLLSPRNQIGGSFAGTVDETPPTTSGTVSLDTDRLYASLDELIFRYPNPGDPPSPRVQFPNTNLSGTNGKSAMEELKFFLTANSRAPELTPFNTPKVSMWPQWSAAVGRNLPYASGTAGAGFKTSEALLAFCSSFGTSSGTNSPSGKNEYFFQRFITSDTADFNTVQVYPDGLGAGWFVPILDWNQVTRNRQIAHYLYNLGSHPIPGYGASFAPPASSPSATAKYSATAFSSLVIQSLDTIRSLVDSPDYQTLDGNFTGSITYGGDNSFQFIYPLVMSGTFPGTGQNDGPLPTTSGTTTLKGFGTLPVITSVAIALTTSGTGVSAASPPATSGTVRILSPFIIFELFNPANSIPPFAGALNVTIDHIENLGFPFSPSVSGSFPNNATDYHTGPVTSYSVDYESLVTSPIQTLYVPLSATGSICETATSATSVTLGSGTATTFTVTDDLGNPVQKVTVTFPTTTVPIPTVPSPGLVDPRPVLGTPGQITVRGVECSGTGSLRGDWRLLGAIFDTGTAGSAFTPSNPKGTVPGDYYNQTYTEVHSLRGSAGGGLDSLGNNVQGISIDTTGTSVPPITTSTATVYIAGSLVNALKNTDYSDYDAPCATMGLTGSNVVLSGSGRPGDWDTGPGLMPDGPYINPTLESDMAGIYPYYNQNNLSYSGSGYMTSGTYYASNGNATTTFGPNRIVSSPVRFGSLSTGADMANPKPWQTLLFCPNPAGRQTPANQTPTTLDHPGFGTPPDHTYLEFFTMPVVQPYAISEPLSTAGKVNLNYQLAPFTYIERSTALRGVLKNTLLTAISANDVKGSGNHPTPSTTNDPPLTYKFNLATTTSSTSVGTFTSELRYDINRDATIAGIEEHYFSQGQLFMYPSQICEVFLVPQRLPLASYSDTLPPTGSTAYDNMLAWWNPPPPYTDPTKMSLTGDNLREEPYDHLYPRLTTQSNTFTVHCRVQVLKKAVGSNPAVWQEGHDIVASEYRGSSLIERYIDPNDPKLTTNWDTATIGLNFAANSGSTQDANADLSQLYKFRVISTKKFAP